MAEVCTPGAQTARTGRLPYPNAPSPAPESVDLNGACGYTQQCPDRDTYCKDIKLRGQSDPPNCPAEGDGATQNTATGNRRPFPGATSDAPTRVDLKKLCGAINAQCPSKDDYCKKILAENIPDPANCPVDTQPEQAGYPFPGAKFVTPGAVRLSDFCPSVQAGANAQCNSQAQYCDALAAANPPVPDPDNCPPGSTNANNAGITKPLPFPGALFPAPDNVDPAVVCPNRPNRQCNNKDEYCKALASANPPLSDTNNCPAGSTAANNAADPQRFPFPGAQFPVPSNIGPENVCPGGPNGQCNSKAEYCGGLAALQPPLSDPQNCGPSAA